MSSTTRFTYLLEQYLSNATSSSELEEFFALLATNQFNDLLDASVQADLVSKLEDNTHRLPAYIAQDIIRNIYKSEKDTLKVLPKKAKLYRSPAFQAAAAAMVLLVGLFFLYTAQHSPTTARFASIIPQNSINTNNGSTVKKMVVLSDGTKVFLEPGSTLHYAANFEGATRDVYLEGEAFFQVTKNPAKPFLVYYRNIVTKVLGTSFTINTNAKTGKIEVAVNTGKVQVFENATMLKSNHAAAKVIVTPNQKAIYDGDLSHFETALVANPQVVPVNELQGKKPQRLNFNQEKLSLVFQKIETAYGIELVVENSDIYKYVFTGDGKGLDLYSMLESICIATNLSYEVDGTKILIKGKGYNAK